MVVAIIAGVLIGALSIVPFVFAIKKVRYQDPTKQFGLLGSFLLTIFVSFVILMAGMIVCKVAFPNEALTFVISEFITFIVGIIVFGVFIAKRRH